MNEKITDFQGVVAHIDRNILIQIKSFLQNTLSLLKNMDMKITYSMDGDIVIRADLVKKKKLELS
jgi:hypothetical protein